MMHNIETMKNHLRDNKKVYIAATVGVVVGAVSVVLLKRNPTEMSVDNKIQQIFSWKPQAKIEVYIEALGDPGNIVQDTTTGTIYASQNQAARALGLCKSQVSQYLNGKNVDLNGHDLIKLGKAQVSQ